MVTPREMLRDYMTVLNILIQNPNVTFEEVVCGIEASTEGSTAATEVPTKKTGDFTANDIEF